MIKNYHLDWDAKIFWPMRGEFDFTAGENREFSPQHHAPVIAALRGGGVPAKELMAWGTSGDEPQTTISAEGLDQESPYGRCLVPASRFELSNTSGEDCIWEFSQAGERSFCFAGIFRRAPGFRGGHARLKGEPAAVDSNFLLITVEREVFPGGPVVAMPVVLEPGACKDWFEHGELSRHPGRLLRCDALLCV